MRTSAMPLAEDAAAPGEGPIARLSLHPGNERPRPFVVSPFLAVLSALAAGIAIDRFIEPWATRKWFGLALAFTSVPFLFLRRPMIGAVAALAAFVALGGGWHHYRYSDIAPDDLSLHVTETGRPVWVRGVVREALGLRSSAGFGASGIAAVSTRFVLDFTEICNGSSWHKVSGRAITIVTGDLHEILTGQSVEAAGQLALLAPPLNPGEFDYRAFERIEGVRMRFTVGEPRSFWRRWGGSDSWFGRLLGRVRSWSRARLFERIEPSVAPLAAALILGQREGIEPEVNDAFARTGTTHLLAISGLQLAALAGALGVVLRLAGLARRPAYLVVGIAMIAYAAVVGPAPSVVRATVMTAAFCLASIVGRQQRSANTLSLAALGTLGVNPSYLFDVGCQLSFLAIGSLIWLVPPAVTFVHRCLLWLRARFARSYGPLDDLEREFEPGWRTACRRAGEFLIDGLVASAVVYLAALPLVAMRFHLISPIGVILNIPLIPLTTAALLLGAVGLAFSTIWGPLGTPFAWAAAVFLKWTKALVLLGVNQAWGHHFVVGPAWGWVLVFYIALVLAVVARVQCERLGGRLPWRRWLLSFPWWLLLGWPILAWLLAASLPARQATLEVEFLSVGHGLAVLIQTPDGRAFLYDCGRLGDPSVGRRIIAPALWARGVGRIEAVYLSHADQDHYDGLLDLLDRFRIGAVYVTPGFGGPANPSAIDLLERIKSRGVPIHPVSAPQAWETAGVSFVVRHPPVGWHPEASDNAHSIVLDIACAGRHLLLTGDLELSGLDLLVEQPRPEPPPEVMLAPHHGGRTANPEWLYEWARPRLIVASQRPPTSAKNDALGPIERLGIPILRTWRRGAIRLWWTADGIVAREYLDENAKTAAKSAPIKFPAATMREQPGRSPASSSPQTTLLRVAIRIMVGLAGLFVGAFACLFLAVVEIGAWALVMPYRSLANSPVLSHGDDVPKVDAGSIVARASDGSRLVARWFPAPGQGATGRTVLLLHGFAENSRALEASRAAALNRFGWNVAALDSRGHGQSEGDFSTFGALEARDIQIWLDELARRLALTDRESIFQPVLWGRSMGAAIALRAAALDSRTVALVLEAPMVDIVASTVAVLRRRRLPLPEVLARFVVRRAGRLAGIPIDRPGPVQTAPAVSCPTAIIHGMDDPIVPISEARRLGDAFPAPPRWFPVPGAKHLDVIDLGGQHLLEELAAALDQAAKENSASLKT